MTKKSAPRSAVKVSCRTSLDAKPARLAVTAQCIVSALKSRIRLFTPVTPSGKRGWKGGGQTVALKRKTRNAPIKPAKNISSEASNMTTASRELLRIGRFGRTGGVGGPPPNAARRRWGGDSTSVSFRAAEDFAITENRELSTQLTMMKTITAPM